MFESLSNFLDGKEKTKEALSWQNEDVKHFVQSFLRGRITNCEPYCDVIRQGVITVRVGSALFHQEVLLLQHDLSQQLWEEGKYKLKTLQVTW